MEHLGRASRTKATYSKGGALLEFDLVTNKIKTRIASLGVANAISVETVNGEDGHLLTGGSDGYVRLWKLSDITLIREHRPRGPEYFISDAVLVPGARRAVVGVVRSRKDREEQQREPIEVLLLDLETGQYKKIAEAFLGWSRIAVFDNQMMLPEGDRIRMLSIESGQVIREFRLGGAIMAAAVSGNRKWLATIDKSRKLTVIDLTTFKLKTSSFDAIENTGPLVVTNDGRYVYTVASDAQLRGWEVGTAKSTEAVLRRLREMHTRVDFITLANDDKWVVTAGNHGDVGIFDRATGRLVSYTRVTAAAFWVERVWVRGDRMIFTLDTGVLFDGRLK